MNIKKTIILQSLILLISVAAGADSVKFVFTDYPPANYIDESGNYTGFLYDITREAFENRLNVSLEITILPWPRCQELVKSGAYDMMLTIPTEERLNYTIATAIPVWRKIRHIYTWKGHPDTGIINSMDSLGDIKEAGYTIVSYNGNQGVRDEMEALNIPVIYASSVEGMYHMLAAGRADLIIEEESIADSSLRKLKLEGKIIRTEGITSEIDFHLLISRKSSHIALMEDLNRVLDEMWKDGTIEGILHEYGQ